MVIRSERTIYHLVEEHLRKLAQPTTCVQLMENPEIRKAALEEFGGKRKDVQLSTNKLSDALGLMWRRGLLTRYPAPKTESSFARYAYTVKEQMIDEVRPLLPPTRTFSKMPVGITEKDGYVEIEFDKFVILVRPK